MSRVKSAIGGIYLVSANETFVGIGHAEQAVRWLGEHGYTILGFDGFKTDGVYLYPLMEYIADLSEILGQPDAPARSALEAAQILHQWKGGPTFVTIVVDEAAVGEDS